MMSRPGLKQTVFLLICIVILTVTSVYLLFRLNRVPAVFQNAYRFAEVRLNRLLNKPVCKDCNVILVSLDTLSANHLPCYGYGRDTAPNLCRFAKNNMFFEHVYANSYYTLPNHISIFTGLYLNSHQTDDPNGHGLNPHTPFLPEILQNNGYYTHFGMIKNDAHLPLDKVYNRGIDDIIGPDENTTLWKKDLALFRQKVSSGKKTFMFLHTYYVHAPYVIKDKQIYTDKSYPDIPVTQQQFMTCSNDFVAYAIQALKTGLDKGAWLDNTAKYLKLYEGLTASKDVTSVCTDINNQQILDGIRFNYFYQKGLSMEKVMYLRDLYDQKIVELDTELKSLFAMMEDPDIRNNTILIITADHGEEFMEHNKIQHVTLYDSNVKIPLIMYVPGLGSGRISSLTESVDLAPTVLDLVGVPEGIRFDGKSLVPDFFGLHSGKGYAIAERNMYYHDKTIRDDRYKLFLKQQKGAWVPYELFDTKNDPGEKNNIIFRSPDIADRLSNKIRSLLHL